MRARDLLVVQAVQRAEEADVLLDRQRFVQRELLRHVADAPLHLLGVAAHVDAVDHGRSRCRLQQPAHHADGRRLAGAVRAEKAEDLPSLDVEADAIDGGKRAEPARQIADEDGRVAHHRPSARCEPGAGELGTRARAREIELGLQQRGLRVQHIRVRGDARAESLRDHAARLRRRSNADTGSLDCRGRRRQLGHPLADLDLDAGIEIPQPRLDGAAVRRRFRRFRANAPSVEQRPANVHADVPRRRPLVLNGKNFEIRSRHVVAAGGRQHRQASSRCRGDALLGRVDAKEQRLPLRPIRPRFVHHRFCRSRRIRGRGGLTMPPMPPVGINSTATS